MKTMKKQKIYLAGRMTGLKNYNFHNFNKFTKILQDMGYAVINPARNFSGDTTLDRDYYLRACIHDLLNADAIYLMHNWLKSDGARLEFRIAKELNLKIYGHDLKPRDNRPRLNKGNFTMKYYSCLEKENIEK